MLRSQFDKRWAGVACAVLAVAVLAVPAAQADVFFVSEDISNASGTLYDTSTIYTGNSGNGQGFVRFDVSALAGKTIEVTSITLSLYATTIPSASATLKTTAGVYAIDSADGGWTESSAPLLTVDANNLLSNKVVNGLSKNQYLDYAFSGTSAELTALVNSWLDGQNEGLMSTTSYSGTFYNSSEAASNPPYLTIAYTVVPEPATMAMLSLGGVMMLVRRRHR